MDQLLVSGASQLVCVCVNVCVHGSAPCFRSISTRAAAPLDAAKTRASGGGGGGGGRADDGDRGDMGDRGGDNRKAATCEWP